MLSILRAIFVIHVSMNSKSLTLWLVIALLVAVGWYAYANQAKNEDAMMKDDKAMMQESTNTSVETDTMMSKAGSYQSYDSSKIAMASESQDVVLFFRASWCPTCKALDADIKAHLKDIPASLTILDVDYDASAEPKRKYGVTYQHTFVQVDASGNLVKKWSGSPTLAELVSEVK